jgi:hypothetical protein
MSQSSDILFLCKQKLPTNWSARITGRSYTKSLDLVEGKTFGVVRVSVRLNGSWTSTHVDADGRKGGYPPRSLNEVVGEVDEKLGKWYQEQEALKALALKAKKDYEAKTQARRPLYEKLCKLTGTEPNDPDNRTVALGAARLVINGDRNGPDRIDIEINWYDGAESAEGAVRKLGEILKKMTPKG